MLHVCCSRSCGLLRVCASSCNCLSCARCNCWCSSSFSRSLAARVCICPLSLKLFIHGFLYFSGTMCSFCGSRQSTCSASLTTLDFHFFASLLSIRKCASNFLEQNECHVLNRHVQVVFFDERIVHVGIVPDHVVMASPHCVQRSVSAALDGFDLVSLVEQRSEGTHLAGRVDCFEGSKVFSSAEQVYPLGRVASAQAEFLHLGLDGS